MASTERRCHSLTRSRQRHDRRPGQQSFGGIEAGGVEESHGYDEEKAQSIKGKRRVWCGERAYRRKRSGWHVGQACLRGEENGGGAKSPEGMVKLAMTMAMLSRARAEDKGEEMEEESSIFFDMVILHTLPVILITMAVQNCWQRRLSRAETVVGSDRSRGELALRSARTSAQLTDGPTSAPGETVL